MAARRAAATRARAAASARGQRFTVPTCARSEPPACRGSRRTTIPIRATINGTQVRLRASDFSRAGSTLQFGMKIWTRIGGSCIDLLPIPQ